MQSLTGHPLFLKEKDFSASGKAVGRGSTAKRQFTLENLGKETATVNVWIVGTDERSESLPRWCTITPKSLKIDPNQTQEITLSFDIPLQAKPDLYNYEILAEAPTEYPNKPPFRRPQQIRISRLAQDGTIGNPPGLLLQPGTTPATPHIFKPGEELEIKVTVENRSDRVDRYYLTCPEWQEFEGKWFRVKYPETGVENSGLVRQMQWLELNPGSTAEISLFLTPPKETLAGNYSPTVRLTSNNDDDLVLLDVIYLQIIPDDTLAIELSPLLAEVPRSKESQPEKNDSVQRLGNHEVEFQTTIINTGNIRREITVNAQDKGKLFKYRLTPSLFRLQPGSQQEVILRAKPRRWMWWRRPLWGKGLEFSFNLVLDNVDSQLLLPVTHKPPQVVEQDLRGKIVWKRRPLWIITLIIALIISGISYFLWKLLYLPAPPKIVEFYAPQEEKRYQEFKSEPVRLNWAIKNFQQLRALEVTHINSQNETVTKRFSFEDLEKLDIKNVQDPERLENKNFCRFEEQPERQEEIDINVQTCIGINMGAKPSGNHTFKLEVFPKEQRSLWGVRKRDPEKIVATKTTETLTVIPSPTPQLSAIQEVNAKPSYDRIDDEPIQLQWKISDLEQIKKINIVRQGGDGKRDVYPYINQEQNLVFPSESSGRPDRIRCELIIIPPNPQQESNGQEEQEILDCTWTISSADVPSGQSQFRLEVFAYNNEEEKRQQALSPSNPNISPSDSNEEPSDVQEMPNTITINPEPLPAIVSFSSSQSDYQEIEGGELETPISFDFVLMHPDQVKSLVFKSTSKDGNAKTLGNYNSLDEILSFCSTNTDIENQPIVICEEVTTANQLAVGDYSFQIIVEPKQEEAGKPITQSTDTIRVQPKEIEITSFTINGTSIDQPSASLQYLVLPETPLNLKIQWQVEGGENMQVELHPWPGKVEPQSNTPYEIRPGTKREIITLKVTDPLGNTQLRSAIINIYETNPEGIDLPLIGIESSQEETPTSEEELLQLPPRP